MKLSTQQKRIAATYLGTNENIKVTSVAGSGKTSMLVGLSNILKTANFLYVAFTNSARDELIKRIPHMSSFIKTTYSLGFSALRNYHNDVDFEIDKNKAYIILREALEDTTNQDQFEALTGEELSGEVVDVLLFELVTHYKMCLLNLCIKMDDIREYTAANYEFSYGDMGEWISGVTYKAIQEGYGMMIDDGCIDFTDMIAWPAIERDISFPKYSEILIDEAHDLSVAQQTIISKMCTAKTQVIYVVDPRQAIFAFAGADASSVESMDKLFDPIEVPLSECFRCGSNIIEEIRRAGLHDTIEAAASNPKGKVLHDSYFEAVEQILSIESENMVLARTHSELVNVAIHLLKQEKPFYYYQGTFGTELINFLKVHTRGKQIDDWATIKSSLTAKKSLGSSLKNRDLVKVVDTFMKLYKPETWTSLKQNIQRFLKRANNKSSKLKLMTMHSCKGQESQSVFLFYDFSRLDDILEMEEQEYNLLYVAYSRAKLNLHLVNTVSQVSY